MNYTTIFALLCVSGTAAMPVISVSSTADQVLALGRTFTDTQGGVMESTWPMSGFACSVTGPGQLSATFSAPQDGARLRVMVDGVLNNFVSLNKPPDAVISAGNCSAKAGTHCYAKDSTAGPAIPWTNAAACCAACSKTPSCAMWEQKGDGANGKDCWLLKADAKQRKGTDCVSGTVGGPPAPPGLPGLAPPGPAPPHGGLKSYVLVPKLPAGAKEVRILKVTEDNSQKEAKGLLTFGKFTVSGGGSIGAAPTPMKRRLEFIGDSDTAGWCADGSPKGKDTPDMFQDAYQTWAQHIARNVTAEVMVEAVSGYGVTKSSTPIQPILDNTLGFDDAHKWDYTKWTPDAVVILIGPNDENVNSLKRGGLDISGLAYNTSAGKKKFVEAYLGLMNQVAKNYAAAATPPKIVHVCGGSLNGLDPCDDIHDANKQFNAQGGKIKGYYTTIDPDTAPKSTPHWNEINGCNKGANGHCSGKTKYNGCDGHYGPSGHAILANDIIPQFTKIMGW